MSSNTQLQKISQPRIRRLRHRNRLVAASARLQARQPALDNYLIREAARANASPLRVLDTLAIIAGGTGYAVGDRFAIVGGTSSLQATGMVSVVAAGVVTGVKIIEPGQYTVNPGVAAATTVISGAGDAGLTVTTALSSVVVGVTEAEILDAIENDSNVAGTVPTFVGADTFRNRRNSSDKYVAAGVPIS